MKVEIIKHESRETTVLFKSNFIEKLFGLKNHINTYFWNGTENLLDGSKIWYEKGTNKLYGRFKLIDDHIGRQPWDQ